jgi:LDH2 family malate/lactate/ureidoglycolate dehydrogenase
MVVDVATMQPAEEFASRMEALVAQTKANPAAPGVNEILVPGEIEQRNAARNAGAIVLPSKTWDDLSSLAAESGVRMPAVLTPTRTE